MPDTPTIQSCWSEINKALLVKHMRVPFVPTIGAVHPSALAASVAGVLSHFDENNFLPYDKGRRWYTERREIVLIKYIYQDKWQTIIPTFMKTENRCIKYYCYSFSDSTAPPDLLRAQIRDLHPKAEEKILKFSKDSKNADSVVFLAEVKKLKSIPQGEIYSLASLPGFVQTTLSLLAKDAIDNGGFEFVWERYKSGIDDGEILVSLLDGRISGAVGPLKIMEDALGQKTRFPVYFGVKKECRRQGIGSVLWNAALDWANRMDLQYIVLQAQSHSPAEAFYHDQGLINLGGVFRRNLHHDVA